MSLRLVVEHSPCRQPVAGLTHHGGQLVIGRGAEADWRLEDPDMFISRKHCLIAGEGDRFTVTDVSRGGLFVDGADAPLGPGQSRELLSGMRLRLGEVVIRAELASEEVAHAAGAAAVSETVSAGATAAASLAADDFFAARPLAEPPVPRPASLPEPIDLPRERSRGGAVPPPAPPELDDPFTLDALPAASRPATPASEVPPALPIFGSPAADPAPLPASPPVAAESPPAAAPPPAADALANGPAAPTLAAAQPQVLAEALLRGMGLDPRGAAALGPEEMERLGARFRAMIELIAQSLRSRAREKGNLRVAQTVIGASDVNPFKFMPSPEEIAAAMIGPPRPGYMDADAAIAAAARDLADHQLRSWLGLQAALRRMVDRFDPEALERELEDAGRLRAILAGGRSALLWQLYRERFKAIAKAAEDRFLGEAGSDFRDAYEGQGRNDHD